MRIHVFKVKKGKEKVLIEWGKKVSTYSREAQDSLREENCLEESLRLYSIGGETYAVGVMCAAKGGTLLPYNKKREINTEHFKILDECLEYEVPFEKVYNVRVEDLLVSNK